MDDELLFWLGVVSGALLGMAIMHFIHERIQEPDSQEQG